MQEEKITLDKETFKTLASETRINILKSLDRRRKTLSELSREFKMSVSTIKEHLDNLASSGLVVQKDEGHKWKYYELTKKGRNILSPGETKILVLLSVSILALLVTGYDMMRSFAGTVSSAAREMQVMTEAGKTAGVITQEASTTIPYIHITLLVIFSVLMGISIGYLIVSRRRIVNI